MNAPKVQNRKSGADANAEVAARAQGAAKRHIGQILIAKGILTEEQRLVELQRGGGNNDQSFVQTNRPKPTIHRH